MTNTTAILEALRSDGFDDAREEDTGGGIRAIVASAPQGEVVVGLGDAAGLVSLVEDASGAEVTRTMCDGTPTGVLSAVRQLFQRVGGPNA